MERRQNDGTNRVLFPPDGMAGSLHSKALVHSPRHDVDAAAFQLNPRHAGQFVKTGRGMGIRPLIRR